MKKLILIAACAALVIAAARAEGGEDRANAEITAATNRPCIFFVGAHPDDSEGFAGTAFLLRENYEIHLVDLTRGERGLDQQGFIDGSTGRIRTAEEEAACRVLSAVPHFLSEINGDCHASARAAKELEELILKYRPKAVFTHWPLDTHTDHIQCTAVVTSALDTIFRRDKWRTELYFYEVLEVQTCQFQPCYSVDITDTLPLKVKMLRQYACQNPNDELVQVKVEQAHRRGREHTPPVGAAEIFSTLDGLPIEGGVLSRWVSPRAFAGSWISDAELASAEPRRVTCRQLQRKTLPPENAALQNRHVLFRKTFELDCVRTTANAYVTADDYYKLYVNGTLVGQGPAAGTPEHTYYNTINVTKFLKPGRNVIAVHTYYQGLVNRVWRSGDNRHGLLLDLVADGRTVVKSDTSFKTARHGGFSALGLVGYKTGFMERYDASAKEVGFEKSDFDDSAWAAATLHPHGGDYTLFPQPTPMLERETIRPIRSERGADGTLRLDFGGVYVGSLAFAAKGPKGSKIGIFCGQELNADGSVRHKMRCNCDYTEEFVLSGGARDILNQYDYKSFRYAELKPAPGVEIDEGSIVLTARHMPFALKAKPNFGDDAACRAIWELCVASFRWGVQEQIQDCMDREKGYYLGDGCYTMYANCLLTGDWSGARRFFDDFLRTKTIDRGLVTCANCSFMQEIAEYPLMMIWFARAYLAETGERAFVSKRFDAFADILDSYRERYAQANGLLNNLDKWSVVEWPANFQDGYDADVREGKVCTNMHSAINAWYVGAVKTMNALAKELGRAPYADAVPLEKAFVDTFWDDTRNLFVDRAGSRHVSLPGNSYAAFFDLAPANRKAAAHRAYLDLIREKGYSSISLFQFVPVFAYLKATGETELLHQLIVSPEAWLRNLREGATRTFEGWGRDTKWNTSLFHLTLASVAIFLTDSQIEQTISTCATRDR